MSAIEKTRAEIGRKANCCWVGINVGFGMVSNKVTFEQRPGGTEGQDLDITKGRPFQRKGSPIAKILKWEHIWSVWGQQWGQCTWNGMSKQGNHGRWGQRNNREPDHKGLVGHEWKMTLAFWVRWKATGGLWAVEGIWCDLHFTRISGSSVETRLWGERAEAGGAVRRPLQ